MRLLIFFPLRCVKIKRTIRALSILMTISLAVGCNQENQENRISLASGLENSARVLSELNSKAYRGSVESLSPETKNKLLELVKNHNFETLNKELHRYYLDSLNDVSKEFLLRDAYLVFKQSDPAWTKHFLAWRNQHGESYQAHLALANHYYGRAWADRGNKFVSETAEIQLKRFETILIKSARAASEALKLNEKILPAHIVLINAQMAAGNSSSFQNQVEQSLAALPSSFLLRSVIANALLPRWGGSHESMDSFAKEMVKAVPQNPRMPLLLGYVHADKASILSSKNPELALLHYKIALSYGDRARWYRYSAELLLKLDRIDEALVNASLAAEKYPAKAKNHAIKSHALLYQKNVPEAKTSYKIASTISPTKYPNDNWTRWASSRLTKRAGTVFRSSPEEAVAFYDLSLQENPDDVFAVHWRGVALRNTGDSDNALSAFHHAIELDPLHLNSYLEIDATLLPKRRFEEIISSWTKLLTLDPTNSEALLERSGTYFHMGDLESAKADVSRACELENKKACQTLNKYFSNNS